MADPNPSNEFFELLQKMWNPMGFAMPGMAAPAMTVEEVEKKIADLRAVEAWLTMNSGFVQMTIKTLEMQKAGLESLQAAGKAAADAAAEMAKSTEKPKKK